ncbi:uncharacterized protein LOC123698282 [Colias croceus]|uniref:uncharacterized protein LOC123698282 n=1 Tax=Colias crocea TaxID=72248 RepID=UPI001E27ED81|nr:uncharacterized protein LOC123698282 [Colias croceus]
MGRKDKRNSSSFNIEDEGRKEFKQNGGDTQQQQNTLFMTADLIPKFTGQDSNYPVQKWIQDIEDNGLIFQWTPLQQLLVARRSLSGTALLWLKSERPFKTWQELAEEISNEFPSTWDTKTVHELMSARKKQANESCIDYLLIMKEMGKRGKLADYVTIKYIVDGIIDDEYSKIMLYGIKTYAELKEKLKIYELVKSKTKKISTSQDRQEKPTSVYSNSSHVRNTLRCYNCGDHGHASSSCPNKEKGAKCFRCNSYGHIASACDLKKTGASKFQSRSIHKQDGVSASGGDKNEIASQQIGSMKRTMFGSIGESGSDLKFVGQDGGLRNIERMIDYDCNEVSINQLTDDKSQQVMKIVNNDELTKKSEEKRLKKIVLNNIETTALMDSGSDVNLINEDVYLSMCTPKYDNNVVLTGLGSAKVKTLGHCIVKLRIDGRDFEQETFYIVPNNCMPYRAIIGRAFLSNVVMVMDEGTVFVFPKGESWMTKINCFFSTVDLVGTVSNESVKDEVVRLVDSYKPQQTKEAPVELKITLMDETPVAQRPRRLSPKEQHEVDKQIQEWLKDGIIRLETNSKLL